MNTGRTKMYHLVYERLQRKTSSSQSRAVEEGDTINPTECQQELHAVKL